MVQPTTIQRAPRLWVALLGIVILTAAAAFVVREVYRSRPDAAGSAVTVTTPTSVTPTSSGKPAPPPGPREVQTRPDAAQHPQYKQVREMLQNYFDGINDRDYAKWRGTVTKARLQDMGQAKFEADFASTKDGNIHLYRIDTAGSTRLRILISFTSTQKLEDAPETLKKECIDWHFVLPVTKEDNKWKIDSGDGASSPRQDECGTQPS